MSHAAWVTWEVLSAALCLLLGLPMVVFAILPAKKFPYGAALSPWKRGIFGFGGLLFVVGGLYGLSIFPEAA